MQPEHSSVTSDNKKEPKHTNSWSQSVTLNIYRKKYFGLFLRRYQSYSYNLLIFFPWFYSDMMLDFWKMLETSQNLLISLILPHFKPQLRMLCLIPKGVLFPQVAEAKMQSWGWYLCAMKLEVNLYFLNQPGYGSKHSLGEFSISTCVCKHAHRCISRA